VELGPSHLVWGNLTHLDVMAEGARDQPYQIVGIDPVEFRDRFPALAPPVAASDARARRGVLAFRRYCMAWHSVNGEGGTVGPELNSPVSVAE